MSEQCMTAPEVAERWGVTARTVVNLIRSGKLRAFKPGKEWRITEAAVREFEQGPPEPARTVRRDNTLKIY